ncbi:MAG: class I SAM-dependent methyltransferase [Rhodoferax sp.]|nr:class I SAM-dependent methyltransferase [Rhodoferax sp.]
MEKWLVRFMGGRSKDAVDWCTNEISTRYSTFNFIHANVANKYANDAQGDDAESYKLPFPDDTYDLVFLTSVFSHMRPEQIRAYLHEISRVMKIGGSCYATYYLIDDFAREQIANNKAAQRFKHDFGNFLSTHKRVPEQTIAVREQLIRSYYQESGLSIQEPILFGSWANRPIHYHYQDVIVATK